MLIDDREIRRLNLKFRHTDRVTDVLSFPQYEFFRGELMEPVRIVEYPIPLGDVVISLETILRRSRNNYRKYRDDLLKVVIHSILHLIGFDHKRLRDRNIMREMEERLFNKYREVARL